MHARIFRALEFKCKIRFSNLNRNISNTANDTLKKRDRTRVYIHELRA